MIVVGSLILAGLVAIGSANPTGVSCFNPHEKWHSCHKNCIRSCGDPEPICDGGCREGCFCEEPYVRAEHGGCVLFAECGGRGGRRHRKCGPNERFKRCKRTCEATCKKRHPGDCSEPCLDFGCQCNSGFVRDRHGDCIPYDLCPSRKHHCGRNERYSNDTNVPDRKCQEPRCKHQKFPKNCPRYSTNGGCVCKDTYVRDNRGRCVKPEHCRHRSDSDSDSRHWDSSDSDSRDWSLDSWDRSRRRGRRHRSSEWWDSDSHDWDSDSRDWDDSDSRDSDGSWNRHGRHHRRGRHGRHRNRHHRRHRPNGCRCYKNEDWRDRTCYDYCHSDDCTGIGCFKKRK